MKLFYCFLCFCIACTSIAFVSVSRLIFDELSLLNDVTYIFYADSINGNIDCDVIDCGSSKIVSCCGSVAKFVKNNLTGIRGESVRIYSPSDELRYNLFTKYNALKVTTEVVDNYNILYCYDDKLSGYINIDGHKINTQVVFDKQKIEVGYPIILTGY